tara:strand:+ start:10967 stop:17023 length:6057 start_codon:yes stop_codon:yes gene_type:complete
MAKKQDKDTSAKASDIRLEVGYGRTGLNLDSSINQVGPGRLTYALNAAVENFDGSAVTYQNELGNELCLKFPTGYKLIGSHYIPEKRKDIFFLANPNTGGSEIGYMDNNDCQYHTLINADCLNFNTTHPIPKVVHRITNCTTEIYWTDGFNSRRYLDIENIPYKLIAGTPSCDPVYGDEVDCNQLKIQPNFSIPEITILDVTSSGNLTAGTYQFAVQYADAGGNELTSYYSVTNPLPIADEFITSVNFNYNVGKSIVFNITNLDLTGQFQYFNVAVIKTINNASSVELVGTYNIEQATEQVTYSGSDETAIRLSISDIFEKFPYYDIAQDVTAVQDVIVWDNLTSIDRINYQSIASQITFGWESYRIPPGENYADELNAANLRGYMRDEVYAFEIVFLLRNGKQTDGFHIPGRAINNNESYPDVPDTNNDFVGEPDYHVGDVGYKSYWKVYNTASVTANSLEYKSANNYKGPYQYGEFAYWESTEEYPCNKDVWGELAGQPIRHHKFPDVLVSPIMDSADIPYSGGSIVPQLKDSAVFPIGVRIDNNRIDALIATSNLTEEQKDDIVGFKIVRGDRGTNKSIVAKGMLRNVNKYTRDEEEYYYPNYPYNDLGDDPFILDSNNAWNDESEPWLITLPAEDNTEPGKYEYQSAINGKISTAPIEPGETIEICSLQRPTSILGNKMLIGPGNYNVWTCTTTACAGYRADWEDPFTDDNSAVRLLSEWVEGYSCLCPQYSVFKNYARVNPGFVPIASNLASTPCICCSDPIITLQEPVQMPIGQITSTKKSRRSKLGCNVSIPLKPISEQANTEVAYRQVFNSPETSFGQPFLGSVLKMESVMFGAGKGHFVEVKDNAKYKLLSKEAQIDALNSARDVANITDFNAGVMFTVYQSYLTIYINGITRKNYAMSFNSRASYDYSLPIDNNTSGGIKQREIDFSRYLIPGVQSLSGDERPINNWNRESSVFIKTKEERENGTTVDPFLFPSSTPSLINTSGDPSITDESRFTISDVGSCGSPEEEKDLSVVSYYASMKNIVLNQWGQIYSYKTIDTGYQAMRGESGTSIVFGGDIFISKFAYKTKLPFFIDNRVGAPDDSDIFYDEIGNVGFPKYWHSSRSILEDYFGAPGDNVMTNLISYKAHNFDCPNDPSSVPVQTGGSARTFYDGYFYLFAYGIPSFYCESTYNVDLRQAFNNKEGDFWPHVSSGIPDDWVQESNVPIAQDNTYYYNVTFSKQNKENVFSHLPPDWEEELCFTYYPFRAIYSDAATANADNRINNWLIYRAISYHDFPQNYGNLISLDGIQNKAILARFENKSLLYNNLLTIDTSNPQAAYIGNPRLFDASPPIDFAETDLGYVGSQHKFMLRIPQGQITADAKRGQVFLIAGTQAVDLTSFASGVSKFMRNHLPFEILRYFNTIDIDNHFNGVGLHGVYDSKFERFILTKLDYIPLSEDVKYNEEEQYFYIIDTGDIERRVYLQDQNYFCNKSWTMSFDFNTKSWISFHSYLPNFYIGENTFFYSGINGCCEDALDFEVLVGELQPVVPETTSSTTTIPPKTTDTTTTTLDCELSGGIFDETSCELEGTAIITVPTPTTTTICQRSVVNTFGLFEGYQIVGDPAVVTTGSAQEACDASNFVPLVINPEDPTATVLAITFLAQGTTLTPGELLYYGLGTDCTFVPDGWYYTTETASNNQVFQVVSGVIQQVYDCQCVVTTTSTTTVAPYINECCSMIVDVKGDTIKSINIGESEVTLPVPGYTTGVGIAITSSKLWSLDTAIDEWDITLNPFTATFNRSITLPVGFTTSSGIAALNNTTIIAVDDSVSPEEVVELDITTLTASSTTQFALQANRLATSNPLYTTDGKLVIINRDSVSFDFYMSQYDYATGVLEEDVNIGSVYGVVLFECDCVIWVLTAASDIYYVSPDATHTLIPSVNLGESITSGSQIVSCIGKSLTSPTTTTTTTSGLTTTTTTTLCGTCNEYQVSGPTAIYYNDCYGIQQTLVVPSGQTENVCSCSAIPGATLIGPCP